MNPELLKTFLAVCRHRNVTRAAQKRLLTQPAASRQIKQFERQLGASLFERLGKSIHLTDAGRALAPQAAHLLTARPLIVHDITTLSWLLGPTDGPHITFPKLNCVKGGIRSVQPNKRSPGAGARLSAALSCYALAVKLEDDLKDEPGWRSRALKSVYSSTFAKAERDLQW